MPAGWAAAAAVGGALISANAAGNAADAQSQSAADSNALQKQMFDKQTELNAPFRDNGLAGQNRLMDLLGLSTNTGAAGFGSAAKTFGASDFQADPGYQFRLDQGQKAIERSAAARGGVLSGAAVKAASDYNQGAASQEYGNAYNRFQTDRTNLLNPLQSLAGQGQTASNAMATNAGNYGVNAGNTLTQAGNAQASGYIGQANAVNNGISQGYSNYQNNSIMNKLFPTAAGSSGGGSVYDGGYSTGTGSAYGGSRQGM